MLSGVNIWPVLAAVVYSLILGFVWYTPILFGKQWMVLVGVTEEDAAADPKRGMIGHGLNTVASFLQAFFLAVLMNRLGISGLLNGLLFGAAVGFFFIGLTFVANDVYEFRPFKLSLINLGYRTVYLLGAGLLIGIWQ